MVPTTPTTRPLESIVLAIPTPATSLLKSDATWMESDIHISTLMLLDRLSKKKWLSKTIVLISPHDDVLPSINMENITESDTSALLEKAVNDFLAAYGSSSKYGSTSSSPSSSTPSSIPLLPPSFTSYLIRQMMILDVTLQTNRIGNNISNQPPGSYDPKREVVILPNGKSGLLPNLDLLSTATETFQRHPHHYGMKHSRASHDYALTLTQMHTFDLRWWREQFVDRYLPKKHVWQSWGMDLAHLVAFMVTLAREVNAPHSKALSIGIDSFTIRARFSQEPITSWTIYPKVALLMQSTEHMLHALNSLNERLHHSLNQYLLPSISSFVSNSEYIIPNILVLLPLVVRAFTLAFGTITRFQFQITLSLFFSSVGISVMLALMKVSTPYVYVLPILFLWIYLKVNKSQQSQQNTQSTQEVEDKDETIRIQKKNQLECIQFLASLLCLYLHLPIALMNASLAFPSALFWVPLISFPIFTPSPPLPSSSTEKSSMKIPLKQIIRNVGRIIVLVCISFMFETVSNILKLSTYYVYGVFSPLYFVVSVLYLHQLGFLR